MSDSFLFLPSGTCYGALTWISCWSQDDSGNPQSPKTKMNVYGKTWHIWVIKEMNPGKDPQEHCIRFQSLQVLFKFPWSILCVSSISFSTFLLACTSSTSWEPPSIVQLDFFFQGYELWPNLSVTKITDLRNLLCFFFPCLSLKYNKFCNLTETLRKHPAGSSLLLGVKLAGKKGGKQFRPKFSFPFTASPVSS